MRSMTIAAILGFTSLASTAALAWDAEGHRVIARIAEQNLSPAVRAKITIMLAADKSTAAARDFISASTWADEVQDNRTHPWHFADISAGRPNIPEACFGQPPLPAGSPASKGPEKDCVIDKVNQFAAELADPKTAPEEKIAALKFLLNLLGDLHQPLRVADENDDHGMKTKVVTSTTTPGDLFTHWDKALVTEMDVDDEVVAKRLIPKITANDRAQWSAGNPQLWALEAHQLGVDRAYGMVGNMDAAGNSILKPADVDKAVAVISTQLSRAGVRIAYVLNNALGPHPKDVTKSASGPTVGDAAVGRQLAEGACTVCHVIAPDQTSPRHEVTAPDFRAIANTNGTTQVSLRTFLASTHPTMPNIKLSPEQRDDLSAFILSLKKKAAK